MTQDELNFYQQVYVLTRAIPPGKVLNYGELAYLLGRPNAARAVGYALQNLAHDSEVPWHRVVGKHGTQAAITIRASAHGADEQIARLQAEGIVFDKEEHFPLLRYLWQPEPEEVSAIMAEGSAGDA